MLLSFSTVSVTCAGGFEVTFIRPNKKKTIHVAACTPIEPLPSVFMNYS